MIMLPPTSQLAGPEFLRAVHHRPLAMLPCTRSRLPEWLGIKRSRWFLVLPAAVVAGIWYVVWST